MKFDQNNFFSVYPNPTVDNVTVRSIAGAMNRIYDALGNQAIIHQQLTGTDEISLKKFVKGLYTMVIEKDGKVVKY